MSFRMVAKCWEYSDATGTKLLVLLAIADAANEEGQARPSQATIIARSRASESTVKRHLKALVDDGELAVLVPGDGRRATRYMVLVGAQNEGVQNEPPADSEGVQNGPPGGPQLRTPRGSTAMDPERSLNDHLPNTTPPPAGDVWDSMVKVHGFEPEASAEVKRWRRAATELARLGASGEEYERRAGAYRHAHPTWAFTPKAIVGRWGELDTTAAPAGQIPIERRVLRFAAGAAGKFDEDTFEGLLEEHYGSAPAELLDQARTIYQEARIAA